MIKQLIQTIVPFSIMMSIIAAVFFLNAMKYGGMF